MIINESVIRIIPSQKKKPSSNLGSDELFLGLFYVGELKENHVLPSGKRDDWQKKVEFITTV